MIPITVPYLFGFMSLARSVSHRRLLRPFLTFFGCFGQYLASFESVKRYAYDNLEH